MLRGFFRDNQNPRCIMGLLHVIYYTLFLALLIRDILSPKERSKGGSYLLILMSIYTDRNSSFGRVERAKPGSLYEIKLFKS